MKLIGQIREMLALEDHLGKGAEVFHCVGDGLYPRSQNLDPGGPAEVLQRSCRAVGVEFHYGGPHNFLTEGGFLHSFHAKLDYQARPSSYHRHHRLSNVLLFCGAPASKDLKDLQRLPGAFPGLAKQTAERLWLS